MKCIKLVFLPPHTTRPRLTQKIGSYFDPEQKQKSTEPKRDPQQKSKNVSQLDPQQKVGVTRPTVKKLASTRTSV